MGLSLHAIDSNKFSLFCLTISIFFSVNVITMNNKFQYHVNVNNKEGYVLNQLEWESEGDSRREPFHNKLNLNTCNHHVNSTVTHLSDDTGDGNDDCVFETM